MRVDHRKIDEIRGKVEKVLSRYLGGQSLKEAMIDGGLSAKEFFYALRKDASLNDEYNRALEIKADLLVDEILHIADNEPDAARASNRIKARQWIAERTNRTYSNKLISEVTVIDVAAVLKEARERAHGTLTIDTLQPQNTSEPVEFMRPVALIQRD